MKIILVFCAVLIMIAVLTRYIEKTGIFYPDSHVYTDPSELNLPFEDLAIKTSDGFKLHGWLVKNNNAISTVVFFHGNAGNIASRLEKLRLFHEAGLNVVIIDYRGYGKSEGTPTEPGLYRDAVAVYDYLKGRKDLKGQKLISYGASLGQGYGSSDLSSDPVIFRSNEI